MSKSLRGHNAKQVLKTSKCCFYHGCLEVGNPVVTVVWVAFVWLHIAVLSFNHFDPLNCFEETTIEHRRKGSCNA